MAENIATKTERKTGVEPRGFRTLEEFERYAEAERARIAEVERQFEDREARAESLKTRIEKMQHEVAIVEDQIPKFEELITDIASPERLLDVYAVSTAGGPEQMMTRVFDRHVEIFRKREIISKLVSEWPETKAKIRKRIGELQAELSALQV